MATTLSPSVGFGDCPQTPHSNRHTGAYSTPSSDRFPKTPAPSARSRRSSISGTLSKPFKSFKNSFRSIGRKWRSSDESASSTSPERRPSCSERGSSQSRPPTITAFFAFDILEPSSSERPKTTSPQKTKLRDAEFSPHLKKQKSLIEVFHHSVNRKPHASTWTVGRSKPRASCDGVFSKLDPSWFYEDVEKVNSTTIIPPKSPTRTAGTKSKKIESLSRGKTHSINQSPSLQVLFPHPDTGSDEASVTSSETQYCPSRILEALDEEDQRTPIQEDRDNAKTPDSYLNLLIESNLKYFAPTPYPSQTKAIPLTDLADRESSSLYNNITVTVRELTTPEIDDIDSEFQQRSEARKDRYQDLQKASDIHSDFAHQGSTEKLGQKQTIEEISRKEINQVVSKMTHNRSPSSLSGESSQHAREDSHISFDISRFERNLEAYNEVINRGKLIMAEATAFKRLRNIPSIASITRDIDFGEKTLEESVELRTPAEPLQRQRPSPGKLQETCGDGITYVEFPNKGGCQQRLQIYVSRADALSTIWEQYRNSEYSDYLIWNPKTWGYKMLPIGSDIPGADELDKERLELAWLPLNSPLSSEASSSEQDQTSEDVGSLGYFEDLTKAQSTSKNREVSKYDAATDPLKPQPAQDTRAIPNRSVERDNVESMEYVSFASGFDSDNCDQFEVDSDIGREFLGSDYSKSEEPLDPKAIQRIYDEVWGGEEPKPVKKIATWFDLGRDYMAAHPDTEDINDRIREDTSSSTCSSVSFLLEERDVPDFADNARQVSEGSSIQPVSKQVKSTRFTLRLPLEPGMFSNISSDEQELPTEDTKDGSSATAMRLLRDRLSADMAQALQRIMHGGPAHEMNDGLAAGVNPFNLSDSDDNDVSGLDQRVDPVELIAEGVKIDHWVEQFNNDWWGLAAKPWANAKGKMPLRTSAPSAYNVSPTVDKATDSTRKMKENVAPKQSSTSSGDQGALPRKIQITSEPKQSSAFDALEPFQKPQTSERQPIAIMADDLNIRFVGKAARINQNKKDSGKVGALVDIFQAHGLMPQRMRPELSRSPSPVGRQQHDVGTSELPPADRSPKSPMKRVFSRISVADTEASSSFGEDLERNEKRSGVDE